MIVPFFGIQVYKKTLNHKLLVVQETRDRDIVTELMNCIPPDPILCLEHTECEVEQYCKTCNKLVCERCIILQHNGHSFEGLRSFSDKRKAEMREGAHGMGEAMGGIEETIASCKTMMQRIEVRKKSVDDGIQVAFQELYQALQEREQQLLAESSEICVTKTATLAYQIEELVKMKEELKYCSITIFDVQKSFNDGHLLSIVSALEGRRHELMRRHLDTPMKLREDETISLTLQTTPLLREISEFGLVGRTSGTYRAISKPIMTIPGVNSPYYVSVHRGGDIFVSSGGDQCIYVFDKNGGKKGKIGAHGTGNGQFNRPYGILVDGDTVLVAENAGNRIQRLTLSGDFISRFGTAGSAAGQLAAPWGICLGPNNKIYVADCSNQRIQIFNNDGTPHGVITGQGTTDSSIPSPTGVSVDQSGNVHIAVAQGESRCVKVFGADGKYLRKYGVGQVQNPAGIAIDDRGYCIVGDWIGKKLCIFSPLGDLVRSIPTSGYLCGVTIDREGYIYVVDTTNKCIYKY